MNFPGFPGESETVEENDTAPDVPEIAVKKTTEWGRWAQNLYNRVSPFFDQEGVEANAYYLGATDLAKYLLKDLELFPIWSSIMNAQYNFGRRTGSSAPVESEFNKIKTNLMSKYKHLVRVDKFVRDHILYLNGKARLIDYDLCDDAPTGANDEGNEPDYVERKNVALEEVETWRGKGKLRARPLVERSCIACANGDMPGGAHLCIECNTAVHIFPECSVPLQEEKEGYGEKRICKKCATIAHASNEPKHRRPAKYLGARKDDIKDSLLWEKNRPLPVMRNGNDPYLAEVRIDDRSVSLRNTCAFDSLLYLVVIAATDFSFLVSQVSKTLLICS